MKRFDLRPIVSGTRAPAVGKTESADRRTEPGVLRVSLERASEAGGYIAHIGDRSIEFEGEADGDGAGFVRVGGRVVPFLADRCDNVLTLWLNGALHSFEIVERSARRAGASALAAASDKLVAPMPGTVLKINAVAGEAFEAHAPLVIMESMKMEMTISAPQAGRVKRVVVAPGALVEMDALLVELEAVD